MANNVAEEMDRVWSQAGLIIRRRRRRRNAWSAHVNFTTWFGASRRHILLRRVKRRIFKLARWLNNARIAVIVHDTGDRGCTVAGRNAFVRIGLRPIRIHLCPPWFTRTPQQRAAILIHELVHELGFMHPNGTNTEAEARTLAMNNSRLARRSPENYEHLYELYF